VRTELLRDTRFSNSTCLSLYGMMHKEFEYNTKGYEILSIDYANPRRKRLAQAKKEVELIGGELVFARRGSKHVEVHFFIPK
jgi:hypothetical protein